MKRHHEEDRGQRKRANFMNYREHYNMRPDAGLQSRARSRIICLRKFNNWIKSVLIHRFASRDGISVLDLCCGKGGDLLKWSKARAGHYVGADHAEVSVRQAMQRYNNSYRLPFPALFIAADCSSPEHPLASYMPDKVWFDVCSCQFSLHYSFESRPRIEALLKNATDKLVEGGVFIGTMPDPNVLVRKLREAKGLEYGNSIYSVRFAERFFNKNFPKTQEFGLEYGFFLEDAVGERGGPGKDPNLITYVPEYLVPLDTFARLASSYGLELEFKANFHDFFYDHCEKPEYKDLLSKMHVLNDDGTVPPDEWDAAYLYMVFVFRKRGAQGPVHGRCGREPVRLTDSDLIKVEAEASEWD